MLSTLFQMRVNKTKKACETRVPLELIDSNSFNVNGSNDSFKESIQMNDSFTSLNLWHLGECYNSISKAEQCNSVYHYILDNYIQPSVT